MRYFVFARQTILAIIVRGLFGIQAVSAALERPYIHKLLKADLTHRSWRAVRKEVFVNLDSPKDAQHAEGRIAALSGNHPLNALCFSAMAHTSGFALRDATRGKDMGCGTTNIAT